MESQTSNKTYHINDISIDYLLGEKGYCLRYHIKRTNGILEELLVGIIGNLNIPLEFQGIKFPMNNTEELMKQFILFFEKREQEQERKRAIKRERERERIERQRIERQRIEMERRIRERIEMERRERERRGERRGIILIMEVRVVNNNGDRKVQPQA